MCEVHEVHEVYEVYEKHLRRDAHVTLGVGGVAALAPGEKTKLELAAWKNVKYRAKNPQEGHSLSRLS